MTPSGSPLAQPPARVHVGRAHSRLVNLPSAPNRMFVFVRALTYATLFVSLFLVLVPARVLEATGLRRPSQLGLSEWLGIAAVAAGAVLALSCVLAFAAFGRGTPAPFDPPRRLVVKGPYRYVRNPMFLGAGTALAGAALFYYSAGLFIYTLFFLLAAHLFVVGYEEPTLQRTFGSEYTSYAARTRRWLPVPKR